MLQLEMQPQNVEVNSFIMVDSDKNVKLLKKINELNNNLSVAEIRKLNCESPRPKVRGFLVVFIY